MFSSTLKRPAATLAVVAGLLAAAGPASAQILDGGGYLATDPSSEVDNQVMIIDGNNLDRVFQITADAGSGDDKVKSPTTATTGGFRGEVTGLEPH